MEAKYLIPFWPSWLVDNAKDPNYEHVNFSYHTGGSKVEMSFWDED